MFCFLPGIRRKTGLFSLFALLVPSAILVAAPVAFPQYTGYWHTSGGQILDSSGKDVRIGGVNWYGFETTDGVVHGLSNQDYKVILASIKNLGYNTVRLPYANQIVEHPFVPNTIGYSRSGAAINTDLKGLNSLQVMDKIFVEASQLGLKIILDNHRSEAGNSAESSGLWYTGTYPESSWIADWQTLTKHYSGYYDSNGYPTLIGVDLRNEPHNATSGGACWTGDSSSSGCSSGDTSHNWPAAAGRAGNAVLAINSNLLVFVEGTDCYNGDCDFWGGNLEGAKANPVSLSVARRLVYSAHDYGPTEYRQSWFNSSTSPQSLAAVWTKFWAYLSIDGIAPVWVGEFGTTNDAASAESNTPGSEGQWFSSLVNFIANEPALNWTYWALNGEDNYGLLDSNYDTTPPSSLKQQLLSSIQAAKPTACSAAPGVPSGLTAKASSFNTIVLGWSAVKAPANCSVAYSLYRSVTSSFTPSASTLIVSGLSGTTYSNSGLAASTTYYYVLEATDADGSSAASAKVAATTSAAPVCASIPAAPAGLKAVASSSSAIGLSWTAVAAPANCSVNYAVYRGTASGFTPSTSNQIAGGLTTPSSSNSGLSAATAYYYLVKASDAKGLSASSNQATATTAKVPTTSCHVTYSIQSQWATGFQAGIAIENTGSTSINNWTLGFTFAGNQKVSSLWNANYAQSGEKLTLTNESYNGSIPAGGSYSSIGFTATFSGSNPAPTAFSLNGTPCR